MEHQIVFSNNVKVYSLSCLLCDTQCIFLLANYYIYNINFPVIIIFHLCSRFWSTISDNTAWDTVHFESKIRKTWPIESCAWSPLIRKTIILVSWYNSCKFHFALKACKVFRHDFFINKICDFIKLQWHLGKEQWHSIGCQQLGQGKHCAPLPKGHFTFHISLFPSTSTLMTPYPVPKVHVLYYCIKNTNVIKENLSFFNSFNL